MKGSDLVEMTIKIAGEIITLKVKFDDQLSVRETEQEVKLYIEKMRKAHEDSSDRELLAMAAYRYASLYLQLFKIQQEAINLANMKCRQLEDLKNPENINYPSDLSILLS